MASPPAASTAAANNLGRNLTYGLQEVIGRAIVVGEYATGKPFPTEADLARQHGVSRSVTREAMKMLAAKGLLGARPRQGTFVQPDDQWNLFDTDVLRWILERKLSVKTLRQFNELRIGVEPRAAALAAQRARPSQVAAIAAGLQRMRDAERGQDDTLSADIEFHVAVLRASGNPFYVQFRDIVSTALRTSIRFTNRIAGRSASIDDHAMVHSAIASGQAQAAHDAMYKLIDDVLDLIGNAAE
ncbi:FadR/GntR family transcriptional regulator [Stakelama saccharophila]|uniref:FadR/GntR family transcriptional regulator n=1 Tax=Stakelama saccharophila TaxID=3075605 RepID=A0ABZ0B829_9SPHN|nr:FadR/GntR family transcriptional regulator [Stakelama sp. W311]WNO53571.1 FadR/GntR family transcriptional regulator [Stakelama sp. W311]